MITFPKTLCYSATRTYLVKSKSTKSTIIILVVFRRHHGVQWATHSRLLRFYSTVVDCRAKSPYLWPMSICSAKSSVNRAIYCKSAEIHTWDVENWRKGRYLESSVNPTNSPCWKIESSLPGCSKSGREGLRNLSRRIMAVIYAEVVVSSEWKCCNAVHDDTSHTNENDTLTLLCNRRIVDRKNTWSTVESLLECLHVETTRVVVHHARSHVRLYYTSAGGCAARWILWRKLRNTGHAW